MLERHAICGVLIEFDETMTTEGMLAAKTNVVLERAHEAGCSPEPKDLEIEAVELGGVATNDLVTDLVS